MYELNINLVSFSSVLRRSDDGPLVRVQVEAMYLVLIVYHVNAVALVSAEFTGACRGTALAIDDAIYEVNRLVLIARARRRVGVRDRERSLDITLLL